MICYFDTETCGLCGPAVTIQYAYDDGNIITHDCWSEPIADTLKLIEDMMKCDVIGFNLVFDMFQLNKLYNILNLLGKEVGYDAYPEDYIEEAANLEPSARNGVVVKPVRACDIMCVARKTVYQSTMERGPIVIRRVPTALAFQLAKVLERKIRFSDIYFARRKDKYAPKWKVYDIKGKPDLKDVILSFKASSSLKALAVDALKANVTTFEDIELSKKLRPVEVPFAPFALAVSSAKTGWHAEFKIGRKKYSGYTWPGVIRHHIAHWKHYQRAREYATADVDYTRRLYEFFGRPEPGDDDSELTCCVGAVRWKGYRIDIPKLQGQLREAVKKAASVPTSPAKVKVYLYECLSETERIVLDGSTKKTVLEKIRDWENQKCFACGGAKCVVCDHTGTFRHPAARRAKEVLAARGAKKEIELYEKLLMAGRFHAAFNVIGALSSRMSGAERLNAQGINKTKAVRSCFPFSDDDTVLCAGDFAGFEVVLADAAYNDPALRRELLTCGNCSGQMVRTADPVNVNSFVTDINAYIKWRKDAENSIAKKASKSGKSYTPKGEGFESEIIHNTFSCPACGFGEGKKIHALFGVHVYPGMTYEQIVASSGTEDDKYTRCKSAVFAMLYGGEGYTLQTRLGVEREVADKAYARFTTQFRGVGRARQRVTGMFSALSQKGGLGSKIEWSEPADRVESLFGFARLFTLENLVMKSLFELAQNPPKEWRKIKVSVQRREDRVQTASGAVQSSLYGAAFGIQGQNIRAAANHEIQSSGAQVTKHVQRKIWDLQPPGVHSWVVQPCNIHDEILCPTAREHVENVNKIVNDAVESFRERVPLISMEWKNNLATWADK